MRYVYNYSGYDVIQCTNCHSSTISTLPSIEELEKFYDGFLFNADLCKKPAVVNKHIKAWYKSFNLRQQANMLDVGGGGGYFSFAFERFGFGKAFYIDIDHQACEFASSSLGLKNVINSAVENLHEHCKEKEFDFIYCRHVIEHLLEPTRNITNIIKLMKDDSVFVLQCPNGYSLEKSFYISNTKRKIKNLVSCNQFSFFAALRIMLSKKIVFGLEPIRHLWSITPKGLDSFLAQIDGIEYSVFTASLSDPVFSPWVSQTKNFKNKLLLKISQIFCSRFTGGAHLVAIIRKSPSAETS